MTLSKLAKLANVSLPVVSKAFSGKGDISDAMREHVFAVAREHGCFQQFYHVPYDKPVIAVILPEVISSFYVRYIEVLGKLLEQNGYTMLLSISNFDRRLTAELIRYYTAHSKVDGLILLSPPDEMPPVGNTAVVAMHHSKDCPFVCADLTTGLREALSCLKAMGHTRVGYVGEELTRSKAQLFVRLADELSLQARPEWVITSRHRFEAAGRDGISRLLATKECPSAVFGAYSYITRGILAGLRDRGADTPAQMSVISMDSDPAPLDPELDVACIPPEIERCCEVAVRMLGERLRGEAGDAFVRIPTRFWPGESLSGQG